MVRGYTDLRRRFFLTRLHDDRVLALVKTSHLKDYDPAMRKKLLDTVIAALDSHASTKGKTPYIGVKGKLLYGITHVPPDKINIGDTVPDSVLVDFYGPPPAPAVAETR